MKPTAVSVLAGTAAAPFWVLLASVALWDVDNAAGVPIYLVLSTVLALPIAAIVAYSIAPRLLTVGRSVLGNRAKAAIVTLAPLLAVSCAYAVWALISSGMLIDSWWALLLPHLAFFLVPVPFVSLVAYVLTDRSP